MPTKLLARMTRRPGPVTNLGGHETVALFPSLGHLDPAGRHWHVQVHGEVFAAGRIGLGKRFLLKMLQRAMQAPDAALETDLFRQRIARFLASDCPGRRIAVRLGQDVHVLARRSRRNGHFFGALRIPVDQIQPPPPDQAGSCGRLTLAVHHPSIPGPPAHGHAFLLGPQGLSVISDIDDTLKHSHVACQRTLLANTFLREFEPIAGMADVLTRWADQGAAFHYVSSSPWQLYRHLAAHLELAGFPDGSYHLRAFRLRDHLIRRILMLRRSGKAAAIRTLLATFPRRRFVLLGDSGEIDPEIYGILARKFPRQVAGIYIRQLGGPRDTPARYREAFRGLAPDTIRLFREASDLADLRLPA